MSRASHRMAWGGWGLLFTLGLFSLGLRWLPAPWLYQHCPLGADVLRPDQSVCELALGGLWVSMAVGLSASCLATLIGLMAAVALRSIGGRGEGFLLRGVDAVFALPDVLVVMVLQLAAQTFAEAHPGGGGGAFGRMVWSLALVGWAGPARMLRNRLLTLSRQDFVAAARALGASQGHVLKAHLWPSLRPFLGALFLSRFPAAILAESTVSFLGVAQMEPMSLGRYLGTSYSALLYPGGMRVVLPAWLLLVTLVLAASLASRALIQPAGLRAR